MTQETTVFLVTMVIQYPVIKNFLFFHKHDIVYHKYLSVVKAKDEKDALDKVWEHTSKPIGSKLHNEDIREMFTNPQLIHSELYKPPNYDDYPW